jgi:hypothetical protein
MTEILSITFPSELCFCPPPIPNFSKIPMKKVSIAMIEKIAHRGTPANDQAAAPERDD